MPKVRGQTSGSSIHQEPLIRVSPGPVFSELGASEDIFSPSLELVALRGHFSDVGFLSLTEEMRQS